MSKYIIDIPDGVEWGVVTCRTEDGFYTRDFDSLEELNSNYINEHFSYLQDAEYQRGLNDAWEAAKKIVEMTDPPYWEVFNEYKDDLFGKISASKAIKKLKDYEEKQKVNNEIKVGDELRCERGWKGIVTSIDDYEGLMMIMDSDGAVGCYSDISKFTKTGRHFDISKILEEIKE